MTAAEYVSTEDINRRRAIQGSYCHHTPRTQSYLFPSRPVPHRNSSNNNVRVRVFIVINRYLKEKDRSNKNNNRSTITTSTTLTFHLPAVLINRVVAKNNPLSPFSTKIRCGYYNLYYSDAICKLTLILFLP